MISRHLLSMYGENAFAMIIDEGGRSLFLVVIPHTKLIASHAAFLAIGGYAEEYGAAVATPAIGEKGYLDVRVDVTTPGGHSSVPPVHTVRFRELVELNSMSTFTPNSPSAYSLHCLSNSNTTLSAGRCPAVHQCISKPSASQSMLLRCPRLCAKPSRTRFIPTKRCTKRKKGYSARLSRSSGRW